MLKVVIDTNQFISSLITRHGPSAQVLQAWKDCYYLLNTSREILDEIKRVLQYPRISKKYHLTEQNIENLLNLIEHESIVFSDSVKLDVIKEDPDDNKILACAIEAEADYIVSGDKHLLDLRQYKNIPIVTAREFLKIIEHK